MNIYAIRDRLLNYYQQPFAAPEDTAVLAALSRAVSNGGDDVIAQAPHHFEIWRLGKVEETGHITGRPEFIADLNSLVRVGTNLRQEPDRRTAQPHAESRQSERAPGSAPSQTGAEARPIQDETQAGHQPDTPADQAADRGN